MNAVKCLLPARCASMLSASLMLSLLCASSFAGTAWGQTAAEVLSNHVKALGGPKVVQVPSALQTGTMVHEGFSRGFTWTQLSPLLLREESKGEGYTELWATDGRRAWCRLPNNGVVGLQGIDREAARVMSFAVNRAYLQAADLDLEAGEPQASADGTSVTLPFSGAGLPISLTFDAKSWMLLRAESKASSYAVTVLLDDVRKAGDIKLPHKVTRRLVQDGVTDETVFTVASVDRKTPVDESIFERPTDPASRAVFPNGNTRATIPLRLEGGRHVGLVDVTVNGRGPYLFTLDTSSQVTLVDAQLKQELGLKTVDKLVGLSADGTLRVEAHPVERLDLGEVALGSSVIFSVTGLEWSLPATTGPDGKPAPERKVQGVLGRELLERAVVELRYADGQVVLHEFSSYTDQGRGEALPLDDFDRVTAALNGRSVLPFELDTGLEAAILMAPVVAEREGLSPPEARRLPVFAAGPGGGLEGWLGRFDSVQLGQAAVTDVVAFFPREQKGRVAGEEGVSSLGAALLERFVVTFDYARRQVVLEPGPWLGRPWVYDRSGVRLKAGTRLVEYVHPAAEGGLQVGDEVLEHLDGKVVCKDPRHLEVLFKQAAGTKIKVKIKRGKATLEREVVLKNLL